MTKFSCSETILRKKYNSLSVTTANQLLAGRGRAGEILHREVRDAQLEERFRKDAVDRLNRLLPGMSPAEKQVQLEIGNRYPDGSMRPISLEELPQMKDFVISPQDILDRAQKGSELLKDNRSNSELGTAARGIPGGGASTRAAKWVGQNSELAKKFGISEETPRFLYRVGGRTLFQLTLDFSQHIARSLGKVFPNIVMTNSEIVESLTNVVRSEWGNYRTSETKETVIFNQIVMPRMWVDDQKMIEGELYPAGHGDFPYLLAKYGMVKALRDCGIKYLVFSNADEWLWQADPVMISIAQELFEKGYHMLIIGVENTNNQFGGGFMKKADGTQSLVETPRLPLETVKEGKAPIALNTTFYLCDVPYMAEYEEKLLEVDKSMVVKEIPGRKEGNEQILGIDSWAGDVFAAVLNPAFIRWPRLNFLGIKDGSFITGSKPITALGGRTYLHYVHETVDTYPEIMRRLFSGDRTVAEFLHRTGYSYLDQ